MRLMIMFRAGTDFWWETRTTDQGLGQGNVELNEAGRRASHRVDKWKVKGPYLHCSTAPKPNLAGSQKWEWWIDNMLLISYFSLSFDTADCCLKWGCNYHWIICHTLTIKTLIHKPPFAFNTQERESCRHAETMWPDRKHWDTLSRRESDIFFTIQTLNRSQLPVWAILWCYPLFSTH